MRRFPRGGLDRLAGYADEDLDRVIESALRAQLAAGVTTVRDLGDRRWAVLSWRNRVDVVKVMASGGVAMPGTEVLACQCTLEQLRILAEEAHARGLPVTAHAHGLAAEVQAAQAGVDGIEHCSCLTERGFEQPVGLLARLAANRTVVCPTLGIVPGVPLSPAALALQERTGTNLAARQAMTGNLYHAGVRLASGVDAGISDGKPHGILALAIADLVAGGVPPADAIASATSLAAGACGLGSRKGWLRRGQPVSRGRGE